MCFASGILPIVLADDEYASFGTTRIARSTQTLDVKTVASTLGTVNHVQTNNKSQIILLTENSTELNENNVLKEQYELQNETGFFYIL